MLCRGHRKPVSTPKTLDAIMTLTYWRIGARTVGAFVGLHFLNRLLEAVEREQPDVVISTYPLGRPY